MSRSQRGPKVFMQSDCAACHSMLPYAGLREAAAQGDLVAQAAEITVVTAAANEAQPAARPLHGDVPGLATLVTDVRTHDFTNTIIC
jgi:mono/diheme cytochrome c family protein